MRQSGGAEHQKEGAENALRAKGRGDGRCSEQRDTKAKPLGHQSGEPPWAAVAGAQSRRGNWELRERETGTTSHQKTTGQAHRRRQPGSQAQEESPRQGLDVQIQVSREVSRPKSDPALLQQMRRTKTANVVSCTHDVWFRDDV